MNPEHWKPGRRNLSRYLRDLEDWVEEFLPWEVQGGFDPNVEFPALDETATAAAERIAERMVTGVAIRNGQKWRASVRESLQGGRVLAGLRREMSTLVGVRVEELIAANARLIQAIPEQLSQKTALFIAREQRRGRRAAEIEETLRKRLPRVARSQVKMLARTEVGRAETALTQARAEQLGIAWYEWATSKDSRVRPAHRLVNSVLIRWMDPLSPEALAGERARFGRYEPGTVPNCRCLALPLIDVNEVSWPHKVYLHGTIERVTKAEFLRWNRSAAAA